MKITINIECADAIEASAVMNAITAAQNGAAATKQATTVMPAPSPFPPPPAPMPSPAPSTMPASGIERGPEPEAYNQAMAETHARQAAAEAPQAPVQAAPTVPAPSMPAAPMPAAQQPAMAPPASGERDASGILWDSRIHSANRGLNKDGTWRRRRGVDDATFNRIEAELKLGAGHVQPPLPMPAQQPAMAPPPAPMPSPSTMPANGVAPAMPHDPAPAPAMPHDPAPAPARSTEPALAKPFNIGETPPMAPLPPPVAAPAPVAVQLDFAGFMRHLGGKMKAVDATGQPLLNEPYMQSLCARISTHLGGQSVRVITDVAKYAGAVDVAASLLHADGKW